ncbi:hypothetical protein JMK10_01405 [Rhodovulum sulfidophilum]|nr:hypothetical protein [Rhodovulum sulfidophilum]MCE8433298.1 hypothetical protein [Rhodovulum sulfidophilum]MCF4115511.1 hypothetical protein [Rhodovulum sulfidophilum]
MQKALGLFGGAVGDEEQEFVAAEPAEAGPLAHDVFQPPGEGRQDRIADLVAHAVIDVLEGVDVEKTQRQSLAHRVEPGQRVAQPFQEARPVGEPGQRVAIGKVVGEAEGGMEIGVACHQGADIGRGPADGDDLAAVVAKRKFLNQKAAPVIRGGGMAGLIAGRLARDQHLDIERARAQQPVEGAALLDAQGLGAVQIGAGGPVGEDQVAGQVEGMDQGRGRLAQHLVAMALVLLPVVGMTVDQQHMHPAVLFGTGRKTGQMGVIGQIDPVAGPADMHRDRGGGALLGARRRRGEIGMQTASGGLVEHAIDGAVAKLLGRGKAEHGGRGLVGLAHHPAPVEHNCG